jgi:hypothetical protein
MSQEDISGYAEFAQIEPRHYDRVPSIIDHLTYIDEQIDEKSGEHTYTRKRLTPTEKELYRILRYRAGTGACWRNVQDLADHVGCAPNTITEAKKVLSMPFEQLEGNPLIYIEERMVMTTRDEKNINKRPVHAITIGEIWRFNNAFMDNLYDAEKQRKTQEKINQVNRKFGREEIEVDEEYKFPKRKKRLTKREGELAIERLGQPGPVKLVHNLEAHLKNKTSLEAHLKNETGSLEGSSQICDVNKEHRNKDHCLKTDTKANALARCFLDKSIVEECFSSQAKAVDSLQLFGIKISKAKQLVSTHSLDELILSFYYVKDRLKKNVLKSSIVGYFINTLEQRWYQPALH